MDKKRLERLEGDALTINDAAESLAVYLGVKPTLLKGYLKEDPFKGYPDAPAGAIWEPEGKIMYMAARATGAKEIVDIGTDRCVSATHLALAAQHNGGRVLSLDIWERDKALIPIELRDLVVFIRIYGHEYLERFQEDTFDLIFEDTDHMYENTLRIAKEGKRVLKPGGIYMSHDPFDPRVGVNVRKALLDAGMDALYLLVEPSNCGIAVWRKPNVESIEQD